MVWIFPFVRTSVWPSLADEIVVSTSVPFFDAILKLEKWRPLVHDSKESFLVKKAGGARKPNNRTPP